MSEDSRWSVPYAKHVAALGIAAANLLVAGAAFTPSHSVTGTVVSVLAVAVLVAAVFLWTGHELMTFCLWCIRDSVDRGGITRWWQFAALWFHHHASSRLIVILVLTALLGGAFVTDGLAYGCVQASASLYYATWYLANRAHRHLIVWCPWCRGGGSPERDVTPVPDPVSSKTS